MTRRRTLLGARWAFVLLTVLGAWAGLRGRWSDIADAVAATGALRLVAAVCAAATGVVLTAALWRLLLRWSGADVTVRQGSEVFLVGQLGKYVPGSVWSLAVQAQLGRRLDVPVRTSVTASTLFLLVHTATGLLLGGGLVLGGALDVSRWDQAAVWAWLAWVAGAVALAPPLLRRVGSRLGVRGENTTYGVSELLQCMALMVAVWGCYGVSLLVLLPPGAPSPGFIGAVTAFAAAHAVGVLIIVAPAGVGAREIVLVALLTPTVGVPAAAAAAVLSRVAHVLADFAVAAAVAGWARGDRAAEAREPAGVRAR